MFDGDMRWRELVPNKSKEKSVRKRTVKIVSKFLRPNMTKFAALSVPNQTNDWSSQRHVHMVQKVKQRVRTFLTEDFSSGARKIRFSNRKEKSLSWKVGEVARAKKIAGKSSDTRKGQQMKKSRKFAGSKNHG